MSEEYEEYEEAISCKLCSNTSLSPFTLWPCLHSFCKSCANKHFKGAEKDIGCKFHCPVCKEASAVRVSGFTEICTPAKQRASTIKLRTIKFLRACQFWSKVTVRYCDCKCKKPEKLLVCLQCLSVPKCVTCNPTSCVIAETSHELIELNCTEEIKKSTLCKAVQLLSPSESINNELKAGSADMYEIKGELPSFKEEQQRVLEEWYDNEINNLYQDKQRLFCNLQVFNYKSDCSATASLTEFKSSSESVKHFHRSIHTLVVAGSIPELDRAHKFFNESFGSLCSSVHILKDDVRRLCGHSSAFAKATRDRMLSATSAKSHPDKRSDHKVIHFPNKSIPCITKDIEVEPIKIHHKSYSLLAKPIDSAEVVSNFKSQFSTITKIVFCINNLQLHFRVCSQEKPSIVNTQAVSLHAKLLKTVDRLHKIASSADESISTAVMFLNMKDDEHRFLESLTETCVEGEKLSTKVMNFKEELFSVQEKVLEDNTTDQTGRCMLLDILFESRMCLAEIGQILKEFSYMKEFLINEHVKLNFKEIYKSFAFQRQMIFHYSRWIALQGVCKNISNLISLT